MDIVSDSHQIYGALQASAEARKDAKPGEIHQPRMTRMARIFDTWVHSCLELMNSGKHRFVIHDAICHTPVGAALVATRGRRRATPLQWTYDAMFRFMIS